MRTQILHTLLDALINEENVLAFWEAGSTATGRADTLSDLDLYIACKDGATAQIQAVVESALLSIAPFEVRFEVPQPTAFGQWQAFYRLEGAHPYLVVDLCIWEEKVPSKLLEPEMHGTPRVLFDRAGVTDITRTPAGPMAARLAKRIELLLPAAEIFSPFVQKEVTRGREVDALDYHQNLMARLVEALRIRYAPWRYNFRNRYLGHDLPAETYAEVKELLFIGGAAELPAKTERMMTLLRETVAHLKGLDLASHLEEHR